MSPAILVGLQLKTECMKKYISIIVLFCYSLLLQGQERVLKVSLDGIVPYDTLKCITVMEYSDNLESLGKWEAYTNCWYFHLPDTLLERARYIRLSANQKDKPEIKDICPFFRIITARDTTLYMNSFSFFENVDTLSLHAEYLYQDTVRNSMYYGTFGSDKLIITSSFNLISPSTELTRTVINNNDFYVKYRDLPLEQRFAFFHRIISDAPDSHSNMVLLYGQRDNFTLEQLLSLRALFSEARSQSYYGKKLDAYIRLYSDRFSDIRLINCLTKQEETIVADENKYTLLVFSASWCAPCHKLIPSLKELYEKKKEVMDVVYVTLDTPEQLPAWNQLLEKENISWRSLTVGGKLNEIREKYKVRAIPYSYLIYPQKSKTEKIDIRDKDDKLKIENLNLIE